MLGMLTYFSGTFHVPFATFLSPYYNIYVLRFGVLGRLEFQRVSSFGGLVG